MVNWQPLLDGSVDGLNLEVGGARVGDPLNALPLKDITAVIPETPQVRQRGNAGASAHGADEPGGAVTQGSPLDELRKHGGYVHAGTEAGKVAYKVTHGLISKIWVRGALLKPLPFTAEADIGRVLGPSKGIEREFGCAVHHYPERGFAVGWHMKENRLEHITLGTADWAPSTFGARQVLREWLAAAHAGLAPNWEEPTDRATSLWVRHARVMALLRAYELGSPQDFAEGKFLERRPLSAYPLATRELQEAQERGARHDPGSLSRFFWWLLSYRMEAEKLLQLNSGWLVAGDTGVLAALEVTKDADRDVAAALEKTETLLVELIDPSGKQVMERELIERWGWPDVDLDELLADEM